MGGKPQGLHHADRDAGLTPAAGAGGENIGYLAPIAALIIQGLGSGGDPELDTGSAEYLHPLMVGRQKIIGDYILSYLNRLDQADLDMVASKPKRLGDLPPLGLRPWFAPPQSSFFAKALYGFQTDRRGRWSVAL